MGRFFVILGVTFACAALLVSEGGTQDKKKPKGMLPAGFKDLNLSAEQKSKVYGIQADYKMKIADLETKIKALRAEETTEVFKVLTDAQREKYLKSKGVDTTKDKTKEKK